MFKKSFIFNTKNITFKNFYSKDKGYGFINLHTVMGNTTSEKSLYGGGWTLSNASPQEYETYAKTYQNGIITSDKRNVIIFKVDVPENGSYKVSMKINTTDYAISNMTIFCGRRNVVKRNISIQENDSFSIDFYTYVSPYYPSMSSVISDEKAIYISFTGNNATLSELSISQSASTTIFVAGDSTLADQNALTPYYPSHSCSGWAQNMLSYFTHISVCNQAHSGMTTNCFKQDGHWDIIYNRIKPNDIVILQFGHNDQKRRNLSPFEGYSKNLKWYCKKVKEKHAIPIIVSPISRIPLEYNHTYYSLLLDYEKACQKVATEENVVFINLHQITFNMWVELGNLSRDFFMPSDITHTNEYGAQLIARVFIEEIIKKQIFPLYNCIKSDIDSTFLPETDNEEPPTEPDSNWIEHLQIPYVDINGIPEYNDIGFALKGGLLDPCVMHLHPSDEMPRAQFLMVYLKALRLPATRPYTNHFIDIKFDEWDSAFVETCVQKKLIDEETMIQDTFRPDDALTYKDYASFLVRGIHYYNHTQMPTYESCIKEAISKHFIPENVILDDFIPRAKCYQGLVRLMQLLDTSSKHLPAGTEIHPVR